MQSLAILDPDAAVGLVGQLQKAGIACETRAVTEESGVMACELLVEEPHYDAACDVVDEWFDDEARRSRMICPKCKSPHLEIVPHDSVEVLYRCMDCGCDILAKA